jgi:putative endonuclease
VTRVTLQLIFGEGLRTIRRHPLPTRRALPPSVGGVQTTPREDPRRRLGKTGERLACEHLARAGYDILERNFRCRAGELDIVAADRDALVFCEVKTRVAGGRSGPQAALDAIGTAKRRRLRHLAREWLHERGCHGRRPAAIRFDAIGVTFDARGRLLVLEHVEDAF